MKSLTTGLLIAATLAVAAPAHAGGWTDHETVIALNPNSGNAYVKLESMIDPDSCGGITYVLKDGHLSDVSTARIFATVLSSAMAGRKVKFYLNGCVGNYPRIHEVHVAF